MKPWLWLRIAAVLQGLGACLNTIAAMDSPSRGPAEEALFAAMQSFHFRIAESVAVIGTSIEAMSYP